MTCLAVSRCKISFHVILGFEEYKKNAGGWLVILASKKFDMGLVKYGIKFPPLLYAYKFVFVCW